MKHLGPVLYLQALVKPRVKTKREKLPLLIVNSSQLHN